MQTREAVVHPVLSCVSWIASTLLATVAFWAWLGSCVIACVDTPLAEPEPQARIVAWWDPLACGDPHRVVVELEDDAGTPLSASAPCAVGGITIDVPHWGIYRGRIYARAVGPEIRSIVPVRVDVDAPIVHWIVETPR